uniref:Ribosomal RNA-processing protein 14/surfeit locus protein 6 C-terminal domain-containing protein n=1 Tax=Heliothis virescens TaxID=7102 RepID=A0A2A4K2P0_HELVI
MTQQKKLKKIKKIKEDLSKEFTFLKNVFSVMSLPLQMKGENEDNMDIEIVNENQKSNEDTEMPKRARSIAELEEKLEKIKSQNKFSFKNKLQKKSLSSKLNKKLKKTERKNKTKVKPTVDAPFADMLKPSTEEKPKPKANISKPVFNNEGKLVFSKFDFANVGKKERVNKVEKDPKKILENLKQQEDRIRNLEEKEDQGKVKEIKEKIAWKNVLQKAEGQKVKDDPILLKKSIKKMDQKKKQSKKQWDTRVKNVEQKKDERQKKRAENIAKKKKEKKSKIIKTSVKRGRVVI